MFRKIAGQPLPVPGTLGYLIKKITPELTPELTPEITPNYVN